MNELNDNIELLIMDGCTKEEAERHLKNGSIVFEESDLKEHFDLYAKEWNLNKEEYDKHKNMIEKKEAICDWSIVSDGVKTYFIQYAL